ncbi:MAG: ATP-dependent DNA helicase RecG [Aureliella sp.]
MQVDRADVPPLKKPIDELVDLNRAAQLRRLGVRWGVDLLFLFPRSYEKPALMAEAKDFLEGLRVTFVGTVVDIGTRFTQTGKHILGIQVDLPAGGSVRLTWFNQPFRAQSISSGDRVVATGVLKSTVLNWEMVQPQVEVVADDEPLAESGQPLPIYPLTEGLKQPAMRSTMRQLIPVLAPDIEEVLPGSLRDSLDLLDVQTALLAIHLPETEEGANRARRRFKLQELLVLQLAITLQRRSREHEARAPACPPSGKIHARILNRLPHTPTVDQERSIADVGDDMAKDTAMNRLLQGDVGSGKTVVAQYAMLLAVAHGHQAALMAPTEVLAQQHLSTLSRSLASSRVRIGLLTASMPAADRRDTLKRLADGEIDVLVGTQSLLSDSVQFASLGLVVVDEQHKFGVLQRAKLRTEQSQPHYLVLSATPIPRTIAMTAFGDLDVSTIKTKPPGRAEVHTYLASHDDLQSWWRFLDKHIEAGRQAYVIAPRVTTDDPSEVVSVESLYKELTTDTLKHRSVALLHGRMTGPEKEKTLREFASGQTQVLVATTVVEVGIDVPNATLMTILDADRLGLSQLHQLRGRVARGSHPGYVTAVGTKGTPLDNPRLKAFEASDDGFELAEMDLVMRGPGDLLGTSQSGLPQMHIASLTEDGPLLDLAQKTARQLLEDDPRLEHADFAALRRQTLRRYGESMQLSDVG